MYSRTLTIKNRTGLHARPAGQFVNCAKEFRAKIAVKHPEEREPVNAKSIMSVLLKEFSKGSRIEIIAEGEDEVRAVDCLAELIESGFGEDV